MSHLLIRSLVRSHRSLTRLLRTGSFARAPLRLFARSLAHSFAPELVGQSNNFDQFSMCPESQWNDYEIDTEYGAIHSSARSVARTAHSLACSNTARFARVLCPFPSLAHELVGMRCL